jgi:hypothetical protein
VGKDEKAEPNDQERVIDQGRPNEKMQDLMMHV